ncbi:MAG: glycosyltransferase family 39 protein [Dehalococcoidia bacterium]|nr:glycosyltransferase family 39 protein [Dehalococcoidia bacterium]
MAQSIPIGAEGSAGARRLRLWAAAFARSDTRAWASFAAVVALAAVLNAWQLSGNGMGNTYYAAAVRSMSTSWHNFFFASFDPGGFISVDKPPVFLWMGALSVRVFGYSSWALLLPSAVAGTATVALLWLIVRRSFGSVAATVAGVVLALTPISVAVDRLNLPEPFLILALVAAAGATLKSLDSGRWWAWAAVAGACVGLAFNVKMLAAWIPGPALALAVAASFSLPWRAATRRIAASLSLLTAVTFAVSFSWMLVVDAWPVGERPYVGGSTDNSVSNLAFNYNGLGRVNGNEGTRGGPGGGGPPANARTLPNGANAPGGFAPNGPNAPRNVAPNGGPGGNVRGAGGIIAGEPGPWRMLDDANGAQIAWFLPFALFGGVLCLWQWRRDPQRRAAAVLWLGWVGLFGGVFSYAEGIYHSYYTAALAPGIAALVGMTVAATLALLRRNRLWLAAIAVVALLTAWLQFDLSGRFPGFQDGARPWLWAGVAVGLAMVTASLFARRWQQQATVAGMVVVLAGLLAIPGAWSLHETANASMNTTLPQAGPRQGAAGRSFGSTAFDSGTAALADWLEAHRQPGTRWDVAVASAQNASTLIADFDVSAMAIGGFSGNDPTITAAQFGALVASGDVRYVLVSGGFGPGGLIGGRPGPVGGPGAGGFPGGPGTQFGGPGNPVPPGSRRSDGGTVPPVSGQGITVPSFAQGTGATQPKGAGAVLEAVRAVCTPINASDLPTQYRGGVYDCAGAAAALERR